MRVMHFLILLLALSLAPSFAQQSLSIATGGTGGVYYVYGGGLAELINRHIEGYTAVAEVTGASVENMANVFRGESDIALALADTVLQAYTGTGEFEGRALENLRALASIYVNAIHIVTLEGSGIETLDDLRGRRVSVGAPGSGTEVSAQTILEANGITYDDFSVERLNFVETASALRDGQIDVGFYSVGPPTSALLDLATTREIKFIQLSEDEINAAIEAEPTFTTYTMAAGLYPGQDEEIITVGTPNLLVVNEDMPDELAYQIVGVLYEHVDELIAIHPAAQETMPELTLEATPIALHPGAARYYQERGMEVPEAMLAD